MPGIHVRTSGKLDWVEREKEPVLTVPGSYWLCHKKNIYKFTFKYHRNSRDNKEFNYGKELMKVIRRIIKSQPRQGQQFGTRHLLVTYNDSSWTRQDKMFAMLKFRDRINATAFPRAFVLIVKILPANSTLNGKEFEDELIVYEKTTRRSQYSNNNSSNDNSSKDASSVDLNNDKVQDPKLPTRNSNRQVSSTDLSKRSLDNSKDNTAIVSPPVTRTLRSHERQKKTNSASFFADLNDLPLLEKYLSEQKDADDINTDNQECLNELQETVDMPYQYLIEREIERTKSRLSSQKMIVDDFNNLDKTPREKRTSESMAIKSRSNSTSNIIDNATARSSNITDLLSEGLMFTIRQDQDTVTVVEQKTKLEPDEVLENSEKIETKEGAECLVNSSLLKLENLITKIEMSSANKASKGNEEEQSTLTQLNSFSAIDVNNVKGGAEDRDVDIVEHNGQVDKKELENKRDLLLDKCEMDKSVDNNTRKVTKELFNNGGVGDDDEDEDDGECTDINPEINIDGNKALGKPMIVSSPRRRRISPIPRIEQSKEIPLVTLNMSNVQEIFNGTLEDNKNDACSIFTNGFNDVHSTSEDKLDDLANDKEDKLNSSSKNNCSKLGFNVKIEAEPEIEAEIVDEEAHIIEDVDDDEVEEEEDIIPEAFRKNNDNELSSIDDTDESNLLMDDDIGAEKLNEKPEIITPLLNKSGPRIISSEVVQYDLSSLRCSTLRRRLETDTTDLPSAPSNVTNGFEKSGTNLNLTVGTGIQQPQSQQQVVNSNNEESMTWSEQTTEKRNETPTETMAITRRRRLTARRRLYTHRQDDDNITDVKIEMGKFMRDMTHGVRVVLERLDLDKIPGGFTKNGFSFKCINQHI